MVQFTTLLIIISNLESVLSQESWSNETMSTMSDQDYKTFGNSSDNFERERKFRSAIGYGLTFKKEVEELEKILIIRGLVTRTTEFNDFNSHYFSSSHDDTIQRLVHNGIANSAIVRYFTMQSYPTTEDLIDFKYLNGLNYRSSPAQGLCRAEIKCINGRNIGNDGIEYRTPDGSCNNLFFPHWGMAMAGYWREVPSIPYYDDYVSSPRTKNLLPSLGHLPNSRRVSMTLDPDIDVEDNNSFSLLMMQYGQLISHDFSAIAVARPLQRQFGIQCCSDVYENEPRLLHPECFPIKVPDDDPFYSQFGVKCLNFLRASPVDPIDCAPGPREQINTATAYLDLHVIYGNNLDRQRSLREFKGGRLKVSIVDGDEQFPPMYNDQNECSLPIGSNHQCFKAGDVRANMHIDLTTLHVIFLRMHNIISRALAKFNHHWNDEKLFQESKRILTAMYQHITYKEHLPSVLGPGIMEQYNLAPLDNGYSYGYSSIIEGSAGIAASCAAYRLHTLVSGRRKIKFPDSVDTFRVSDFYFQPDLLYNHSAIEAVILGMVTQPMMKFDEFITVDLAGQLFKKNPNFGMDLAAIDIQRGRDVGLSGYNSWVQFCGREKLKDFDDMRRFFADDYVDKVQSLYANIDDVDFWPIGSAEKPVDGGVLGFTFACVAGQHFHRLKYGDRFWYENDREEVAFSPQQLQEIRKVSMARIICDTTGIDQIQVNPFKLPDAMNNPMVSCHDVSKPQLVHWTQY